MAIANLAPFALALIAPASLYSQPADSLPRFEVVSVTASGPDSGRKTIGLYTYPGGRVRAENCRLDYLIQLAFNIQSFQISGGPRWLREDQFDLDAKPPASSKSSKSKPYNIKLPPNDEQRQMLQAVLADRFHLKFHWEDKDGPLYSLVKAGKELKLQDAKDKEAFPWVGSVGGGGLYDNGIAGINATMDLLAERLGRSLGRFVVDRTGIQGAFDFTYAYSSVDPEPDVIAAILASVQGLGLKLEAGKGPIKTFFVDQLEKPSAN